MTMTIDTVPSCTARAEAPAWVSRSMPLFCIFTLEYSACVCNPNGTATVAARSRGMGSLPFIDANGVPGAAGAGRGSGFRSGLGAGFSAGLSWLSCCFRRRALASSCSFLRRASSAALRASSSMRRFSSRSSFSACLCCSVSTLVRLRPWRLSEATTALASRLFCSSKRRSSDRAAMLAFSIDDAESSCVRRS